MKKWGIGLLLCVVVLIASVYGIIPNIITLKATTNINVTGPGLHRMLLDKKNVAKWWPVKEKSDTFSLDGYVYSIETGNITVMPVIIANEQIRLNTSLFLISVKTDSINLAWVGNMATSYNPFKRINLWLKAKKINAGMHTLLEKMNAFYSKPTNIYGLEVKKTLVLDTVFIAIADTTNGYPSNEFIYSRINKLKSFAAMNNATKESGHPMLNIVAIDSNVYEVKVALPTNKLLPSVGNIQQKRMPSVGKLLYVEVSGGISANTEAFRQLQNYADDYMRKSPAIPFYSLITDRIVELDSSKWRTNIYLPVTSYVIN